MDDRIGNADGIAKKITRTKTAGKLIIIINL
jgi:hypothetical protein